jgi:hypothetical protein
MKFKTFPIPVLIAICFLSCKSDSTGSSNNLPTQTMQGTVNGVQWKSSSVSGTTNPTMGTTTIQGEEDEFNGGNNNQYWIVLTFHKTDTGWYNAVGIADYQDGSTAFGNTILNDHYADTGNVHISQASSTNISGTFNFVSEAIGVDTINVANGSFNVNIQ